MKATSLCVVCIVFFVSGIERAGARNPSGFSIPEPLTEVTIRYRPVHNLIVIPVTVNDSLNLNLILDTGCRNMVLFGRKFERMFGPRAVCGARFSGLGNGKPLNGRVTLGNRVSIGEVIGEQIPVVVVKDRTVFRDIPEVDGVIGYEVFMEFETELNPARNTITFRPASLLPERSGFTYVSLRVDSARPILSSEIFLEADTTVRRADLLIDTGSALGLLVKTTEEVGTREGVVGYGLNGPVKGYETVARRLVVEAFEFRNIPMAVTKSPWHNYASIGMEVLKDYVLVLNYFQGYACFRKNN